MKRSLASLVVFGITLVGCGQEEALGVIVESAPPDQPTRNTPSQVELPFAKGDDVCPEPSVELSVSNPPSGKALPGAPNLLIMKATFRGPNVNRCASFIKKLTFQVKGDANSNGLFWEQDSGGGSNAAGGHIANGLIEADPGQLQYLGNGELDMYVQLATDPNGIPGTSFGIDLIGIEYTNLATKEVHQMAKGLPVIGSSFTYAAVE